MRAVGPCSEVLLETQAEACLAQKLSLSLDFSWGAGVWDRDRDRDRDRLPELREESEERRCCCCVGGLPGWLPSFLESLVAAVSPAVLSAPGAFDGAPGEEELCFLLFFRAFPSSPARRLLPLPICCFSA